jgi:NADH dehydrogenase (ubiquinone) 1 beta subcomplex subunit 11
MSMITKLNRLTSLRNVVNNTKGAVCFISTSPKKSDTATISTTEKSTEAASETKSKRKDWVYYGFDIKDKEHDRNTTHATFFFSTTLCIVFGGMVWYYQPDFTRRDWAQREAYLVLRRREAAGEELVVANYVDAATIEQQLPSDEELGDTEIII